MVAERSVMNFLWTHKIRNQNWLCWHE